MLIANCFMTEKNAFGPELPNDKIGIFWKLMTSLMVVFIAVVASFLFQRIHLPSKLEEVSLALETLNSISESKIYASGGDGAIAPKEKIRPKLPELTGKLLPAEDFSAASIIIKDDESGFVLYKKNEYDIRSMASITKLMSALVILEKNPDWFSEAVVIGEDYLDTHIYAGDIYTLDDLWYAALVGSSNKAVLSIVKALDWSMEAFVERMNQKARELGMNNTFFVEPTGLDEANKSNASDMVILLKEALRQEKISEALLAREYNLYSRERDEKHHMWNTDWLLLGWIPNNFSNFFGGKTGYTDMAGYNFIMQVADEEGHIIDVAVLGADKHESRFTEARDAAEMVFENYQWPVKAE